MKSSGLGCPPCRTPEEIVDKLENAPWTLTYCILELRYDWSQESKGLPIPSRGSSVIRQQWLTVSKAFSKSMNTVSTWQPDSKLSKIYDVKTRLLVAVDFPGRKPCWLLYSSDSFQHKNIQLIQTVWQCVEVWI